MHCTIDQLVKPTTIEKTHYGYAVLLLLFIIQLFKQAVRCTGSLLHASVKPTNPHAMLPVHASGHHYQLPSLIEAEYDVL